MQVVVSGGGIAGLSAAAYLRLLPQVARVTVLEKTPRPDTASKFKSFPTEKKFTGLWTPALKCLDELCSSSTTKALMQDASFISDSGYRGWKKGEWLIKPNKGLSPYLPDSIAPALGFFTNKAILTALHESLHRQGSPVGRSTCLAPEIRYSTSLTSIHPGHVHTTAGALACDLLIAADGAESATYSLLHGNGQNHAASTRLRYRGYDVYRGITRQVQDEVGDSFQMWGPGARFAMVPVRASRVSSMPAQGAQGKHSKTAWSHHKNKGSTGSVSGEGDEKEYAWFAAVSRKGPSPGDTSVPFSGPFANRSFTAGPAQLAALRVQLHGWPSLVESVMDQTKHIDYSDVTVAPAWASRGVEQLSKVYSLKNGHGQAGSGTMPVAFIGDAFHTFDPILAVGAGAALEQARTLYYCLSAQTAQADIATALQQFNSKICTRAQKLDVISDLAQRVGVVQSPLLALYRNALLSVLPERVKGRAMDSVIRIVAGSE